MAIIPTAILASWVMLACFTCVAGSGTAAIAALEFRIREKEHEMVAQQPAVFNELGNVADGWDASQQLRRRIRDVGALVVNEPKEGESEENAPVAKTMANLKYNVEVLLPIAKAMTGCYDKVPCIEALEMNVFKVFENQGKKIGKQMLNDQAWAVRYLFGCLKQQLYRPKVSKAPWLLSFCWAKVLKLPRCLRPRMRR